MSVSFGFHGPALLALKTGRLDLLQLNIYVKHESETPVMHISRAHTHCILTYWVSDVIFSSIQLSQDFKVSNGGPLNSKLQLKNTLVFASLSS